MVSWLERDRAAGEAEVRMWLKSWIPEYAPRGEEGVPQTATVALVGRRRR